MVGEYYDYNVQSKNESFRISILILYLDTKGEVSESERKKAQCLKVYAVLYTEAVELRGRLCG